VGNGIGLLGLSLNSTVTKIGSGEYKVHDLENIGDTDLMFTGNKQLLQTVILDPRSGHSAGCCCGANNGRRSRRAMPG
jgi:hypothetical protein